MTASVLFKVGDILRYGSGPTALFKVTFVSVGHGGSVARYYGQHCMGGSHGAYHDRCCVASGSDLKQWEECKRWRREEVPEGKGIVGAVED